MGRGELTKITPRVPHQIVTDQGSTIVGKFGFRTVGENAMVGSRNQSECRGKPSVMRHRSRFDKVPYGDQSAALIFSARHNS